MSKYVVICEDDDEKIISLHGTYDDQDKAKEEARRMNIYEVSNLSTNSCFQEFFYKVVPVPHNYECPLGNGY